MEGEEEESPTQSVSSVVERPLGTTELDTGLTFEVDLLTIAALRSICVEIAERVAVAMQRRSAASVILITDDELASAIAFWRYAETSLTALERQATVLQEQLRVPSPAKSKKAAAAFETASVVAAGIESLAEILSWLRVDTVYA